MIIFGSRTMDSTQGRGTFHCPRCSTQREYLHKSANRWFTLYFIPVIPLGSAGQFIACSGCGGTFGPEMIHYDPVKERAETMGNIRRALALLLVEAQRTRPQDIATLARVFGALTEEPVAESTLQADMQQAAAAGARLRDFVMVRLGGLNDTGKRLVVTAAVEVLRGCGQPLPADRTALGTLATAIGLPVPALDAALPSPQG